MHPQVDASGLEQYFKAMDPTHQKLEGRYLTFCYSVSRMLQTLNRKRLHKNQITLLTKYQCQIKLQAFDDITSASTFFLWPIILD